MIWRLSNAACFSGCFRKQSPSLILIPVKTVGQNRKARFDYQILETVLAGIMLTGAEAKSCREGHTDLAGAYVSFRGDTPVIKHLKISPYRFAADQGHEPERDRVLLLKQTEILRLKEQSEQKGIAVVPLEVQAGRHIKVLLGIGRGRKSIDKRHAIREREVEKRLRTRGED